MPANVELRLAETSPGPAELAKLAQEVRALSGISKDAPGLLALTNKDGNRKRAPDERADFNTIRDQQVRAQNVMFEAMRDNKDVHFRSSQELALLRDTVDRTRAWSDVNQDLGKREESMKLLLPLLQDLDRKATLLQYNDSLVDAFLTTVQNYGDFWAGKADLKAYLQAKQPPTLWQSIERQEKIIHAILGELKVLMPQVARLSEVRLLQTMLHEDAVAAELAKIPAEKRDKMVAVLIADYPGLLALPAAQRRFTVTQLLGSVYRPAAQQINSPQNPKLAEQIAGTGTLRKALEDRLTKVEGDLRAGAKEIVAKLPDAQKWDADAWPLLQKLVLPEMTGDKRTETLTLTQLKDKYDNAVVRELIKILPAELHDVKLETVRDDIEAYYILRQGIPEAGATAAVVAMLPAKTTIDGKETDTQDCTVDALIKAYPNSQVLRQFCQLVTPDILAKRLRDLTPGDMLLLRSARIAAYSENAEKRTRDMFRIGEPWRDVRGKQGKYETKVATNVLVDVMMAESDRLCDEIFTSGKAGDLPKLVNSYKAVMNEQMKAQEDALSFNAQMMQLLAVQRHFGPMTRLANFNEIRLDPRQVAALQRNLPPTVAAEMDAEWERYGVGLKEYLAAIKTAADRYSNAIEAIHESMVRAADHIAQKIAELLRGVHSITWALPDATGLGGPIRRAMRSAGATWVIDVDGLKALLEEWKGEFVTLRELLTTFKTNSAAARGNVLKDVTQLERLVNAVPPKEMAASEYNPVPPDVNKIVAIEPCPNWLPENVRKAYLDARAALTAIPNTEEQKAPRRIAADRLRAAEQAVIDKYLDDLLVRHRTAKQALTKAQTDNAGAAVIKDLRDELDKILAEVSGVYLKIFDQLHEEDIPAMHGHVRELVGELGNKIDFHGQRFHEYDQMQNAFWSAGLGLGVTYLQYNLMVRPVLQGLGRGLYHRSARMFLPTYRGYLPSFSGVRPVHWLWNRGLPAGLEAAWNNTLGRIPGLSVPDGKIPRSGPIEWAKLKPHIRESYVSQLGKEAQQLTAEAARVRGMKYGPERAKALADLEKRAIALQERMHGMDISDYRAVARQSVGRRVPPVTDIHLEVLEHAHLRGTGMGPLPAGKKWPGDVLAAKKNILRGLDPVNPAEGLTLRNGVKLDPPLEAGGSARYPAGHPQAGQPAAFTAREADDILRSGMAGQRAPAAAATGSHMPNLRAIQALPNEAVQLRRLLTTPGTLGKMTAVELKALAAELRTLNPQQAKAAMEELQAAARADAQLAKALEGSHLAKGLDRAGRSAASELSSLKMGGMVVFEVAMLAFQIYMLYESIQAYNKALEASRESIKNMREQVEKAGFVKRGEYEYHNSTLDVTINLYDLERGLGADANARWRDAMMAGTALAASTAITILSMTSVIGGPVTIVLMIGVVIVEMVVNKISEKIKEGEQKEFLSKCPAWLLMALGTLQTVHDTPDGFLRKLDLGGGVDEAAAKKLVFMMWVKYVQLYAPEAFKELSLEMITWQDQEKFYNEKFVRTIYPEWKRCLFMRVHGRPKGTTMDDETKMNELVKNYYLCEYIPIADMIKTQDGASVSKIRQALVDATVGSLPATRVQRYWKMHRHLQVDGDALVGNSDPPEYLSSLMAPMGSQKTWETVRQTPNTPGFRQNRTIKEHVERWTNKEHGKWLLAQRFGGTPQGTEQVNVALGDVTVEFTWDAANGQWKSSLPRAAAKAVTATGVPDGMAKAAADLYRPIALALLGLPSQAHDEWTKFQHGRWLLLSRYAAVQDENALDVQIGTGPTKKFRYELDGGVWKWRKGEASLAALTVKPDNLTTAELTKFNEIASLIVVGADTPPHSVSMRSFILHADKNNMSPDTLAEPAMYANAPEELYEAIDDPVMRMKYLNAERGEKGSVDTAPWAPGHRRESADQAFAVQTLVRGMWGIPRAEFGHDALFSAMRYERAGGLFANDGEQPHMRRITSATLELFRSTSNPVPVGYNSEMQNYIFSGIANAADRPAVYMGARRRSNPSVPSDEHMRDCFKTAVDHTLTLDGLPGNGPENIYGSIRGAFDRKNLRSVTVEGQLFNEGERRHQGHNREGGEEDVFVTNMLLTFHDGQREYHLRRGVVFRKDGESWRPVWGAAIPESSSSISRDAAKYVKDPAERTQRTLMTLNASERSNAVAREALREGRAPVNAFTCHPALSQALFPGRTNRPLIYVSPEGAPLVDGTPAFDLVQTLVRRQHQDQTGQIDNPAAYFIELTDRALGAGYIASSGATMLTDTITAASLPAGSRFETVKEGDVYGVSLGSGDDVRKLDFRCTNGLWMYKGAGENWLPVSRDVTKEDVGGDATAAGKFNRIVLLALRGLKSKPVLEALCTAVPRGSLGPNAFASRQAATATCNEQGPSGEWKKWNIEAGATVSHVSDGNVNRSLWLSDALSVQHASYELLQGMITNDSREDVKQLTETVVGGAVTLHNLPDEDSFPPQGFLDIPAIPGRQHSQVLRDDKRTVVFQERLPLANARTTRAYIRFETGAGVRLWPTSLHFNGLPNDAALQPHQSAIDAERNRAAQSWNVDAARLSLTFFLSPEAEGGDAFTIHNNEGIPEQYGVSSASQIMQLYSLPQREQILGLLSTPVLKQQADEWVTDAPQTLSRMLRYFPVEISAGSSCRDELVAALAPMLLRAPDQKFFLRQLFHTLLSEGSIRRDNLARIVRVPDLVRASDALVVAENSGERVLNLPSGVRLKVWMMDGKLALRATDADGEDYDVKLERVPADAAAATEIASVLSPTEGGSAFNLAALKNLGTDRVCLSITTDEGATKLVTRMPVGLTPSVAWDAAALMQNADNRVVTTGPREAVMTEGEGDKRRTYLMRKGFGRASSSSSGPIIQMQEFEAGDDMPAMQYSFDNVGSINAFPPSPQIAREVAAVSRGWGNPRGTKTLAALWDAMPATLRLYDGKRPLQLEAADHALATDTLDSMLFEMSNTDLSPRQRQFNLLLTELQDELLRMRALPRFRKFMTTPRTGVEPGSPGFSRSAFEAPIADILGVYYHTTSRDETNPGLNRSRFTAHMAALYHKLNPEQRRAMLERMFDGLNEAAIDIMAAKKDLPEQEKRVFIIDSLVLERIRATEYLRLKHGATGSGDVLSVAGGGKTLEFSFRKDMMYYRKPGATAWKDITVPIALADVDDSATALAHFNGVVMPDLLVGLDMLSRDTLNRLYAANELRRTPGVTEVNGTFVIAIDGKSLTLQPGDGPFGGWRYASRQPLDGFIVRPFRRNTTEYLKGLTNPAAVRMETDDKEEFFRVSQQNVRGGKTLDVRFQVPAGWQFKASGSQWKAVYDKVAAADVGGSAPAAADFNANLLPKLMNWNGMYWPVKGVDIGGSDEEAKKFTAIMKPLSRDFGNVNTGVLNRVRGLQVMQEFTRPAVTEREGVFEVAHQGADNPKKLAMRFQKDGWEFRDAANTWRHIYNVVLPADVGDSAEAAAFFNASVLPKFTHAMLRRTATLAAYEQLIGDMADERELNRVRGRSQSPYFQLATLNAAAPDAAANDGEDAPPPEHPEGARERQYVRYVPETGRYVIVPEFAAAPENRVDRGPSAAFRFGTRSDGDAQTEWVTIANLREIADPKLSADRRRLMRSALATPHAHFRQEALPPMVAAYAGSLRRGIADRRAAQGRLDTLVRDEAKLATDDKSRAVWIQNKSREESFIVEAGRQSDAAMLSLNRELNLLPASDRTVREQLVENIDSVLRQSPASSKYVRLNVAGNAIELVTIEWQGNYVPDKAFVNNVAALRRQLLDNKDPGQTVTLLNEQMNAIEDVTSSVRLAFAAAIEKALAAAPASRMRARLNVAGNGIELVPRLPDQTDIAHRRSLETILNLCEYDVGPDERGTNVDFKQDLLQFLLPLYARAIRKDTFLEQLLAELERADFRIDRSANIALRRSFEAAERADTFVPIISTTAQQDVDLGGCTLRTRPDGPGKVRFEVITPPNTPAAVMLFSEERYDRNWSNYAADVGIIPEAQWDKLMTVTIYIGDRIVTRNMPLRFDTPASIKAREAAREALLRRRLEADTAQLRTEANADEPSMAVMERTVADINAYLPQVRNADGKLLATKELLHAQLGTTPFPSGRMLMKGKRGIVLAEMSGEGTDALPRLRFVRADELRQQLNADWRRLRMASATLPELKAQVREFNQRLVTSKDIELPFLNDDHGFETLVPGHPGYRLFMNKFAQEVALVYAPFTEMPRLPNDIVLPEAVLLPDKKTTITRTEPGEKPVDVSVEITLKDGKPEYAFANVEGADDAEKLRGVGVKVDVVPAQPQDPVNAVRVRLSLNTREEFLGAYAVSVNDGTLTHVPVSKDEMEWVAESEKTTPANRGKWVKPGSTEYHYLCVAVSRNRLSFFRASGEVRERLNAAGTAWDAVPADERAGLPALPKR